tara:strand:+ start:428 stop:661 length:234 start_codon:yes stop_codon:yes gene_type:complete
MSKDKKNKKKIDPHLATFWYHLIEHGLEADDIAFLETLGTLNNKPPLLFIVEATKGYIQYLSQEPDEDFDLERPIVH